MAKVIFTFILSLFILPHTAAAETNNCMINSCEALGYTLSEKTGCSSDLISCPFDNKYTKCAKKFTCSELGFIKKENYRGTCLEYSACIDDPTLFLCKDGSLAENVCLKQYPGTTHNKNCERAGGRILLKEKTSAGWPNYFNHPQYHNINGYEYCGTCFKCPDGYYFRDNPPGVPSDMIKLYYAYPFICDPCKNSKMEKYRCDNLNGVFAKNNYEEGADGATCGECLYHNSTSNKYYALGDTSSQGDCNDVFTGEDNKTYTKCFGGDSNKCPLGKVSQEQCSTWGGLVVPSSQETSSGTSCVECFACPLSSQDYVVADGEQEAMTCVNTVVGTDGQTRSCCNFGRQNDCGDAEQISDISGFNTAGAKCLTKSFTYDQTEYPSGINDDSLYILRGSTFIRALTVTGKLPRLYSNARLTIDTGAQIKETMFFGTMLYLEAPMETPGKIKILSNPQTQTIYIRDTTISSSVQPTTISCGKNLSNVTISFASEDAHLNSSYKFDASCQGVKCKITGSVTAGTMSAEGTCVAN